MNLLITLYMTSHGIEKEDDYSLSERVTVVMLKNGDKKESKTTGKERERD